MLVEGKERTLPQDLIAWDAAVFQALFCLRPGVPRKVTFDCLTALDGDGWLLCWTRRTKTKRGDRRAADPTIEPHVSAASHPLLDAVLARAAQRSPSKSGYVFEGLAQDAVGDMLARAIGPVPACFELVPHGIRAGTDTVLKALRVPDDVIRAFGWWSRPPHTDFYYQSIVADVMLRATRVMDRVEVTPLRPGICAYVKFHGDAIPSWEATVPARPLPRRPPGRGVVESDFSSDDDLRMEIVPAREPSPPLRRRCAQQVRAR
jgi:hypothetical protein